MIARVGISIHATEVSAVFVRGRSIRWHASIGRSASDSVGNAITSVLSTLPQTIGIRRATIVIGPSECRVKLLEGLPTVSDTTMLTRLVHENSAAFFLSADRQALSHVARFENGTLWAAAFDREIAVAAVDALKKKGFGNTRVAPSVVALASAIPAGISEWTDGDCHTEICTNEIGLVSVRRLFARTNMESSRFLESLTEFGADPWGVAAAFGGTLLPKSTPFVWRPEPDPRRVARRQRLHVAASMAFFLGSTLAAGVSPGVRAARTIRLASAELANVHVSQTEFARLQRELRRASVEFERIERFQAQRGKITLLLGALSEALPESTALASLRVDSLEGSFAALTPHAADVLPQLATVADVSSPRIVGSLTKEMIGGVQVQRATVRFRRASSESGIASAHRTR